MGTAQEARVHISELQAPPRFRSGGLGVVALDLPDSQPDDHRGFFIDRRGRAQSFELWLVRDGTSWRSKRAGRRPTRGRRRTSCGKSR